MKQWKLELLEGISEFERFASEEGVPEADTDPYANIHAMVCTRATAIDIALLICEFQKIPMIEFRDSDFVPDESPPYCFRASIQDPWYHKYQYCTWRHFVFSLACHIRKAREAPRHKMQLELDGVRRKIDVVCDAYEREKIAGFTLKSRLAPLARQRDQLEASLVALPDVASNLRGAEEKRLRMEIISFLKYGNLLKNALSTDPAQSPSSGDRLVTEILKLVRSLDAKQRSLLQSSLATEFAIYPPIKKEVTPLLTLCPRDIALHINKLVTDHFGIPPICWDENDFIPKSDSPSCGDLAVDWYDQYQTCTWRYLMDSLIFHHNYEKTSTAGKKLVWDFLKTNNIILPDGLVTFFD